MHRMKNIVATVLVATLIVVSSISVRAEEGETWIDPEYVNYIYEIAEDYGICPEIIIALIEKESSGIATVSAGNCKGLMQINVYCHSSRMQRLGVTDIYDPYGNILVGVDYLAEMYNESNNIASALMHYHGERNVEYKISQGNISSYATRIINRAKELKTIRLESSKKEGK